MSPHPIVWLLIMLGLAVVGILQIAYPVAWYKFSTQAHKNNMIVKVSERDKRMVDLLEQNPEEFKHQYSIVILTVRFSGCGALFIALAGLVLLALSK